MDALKTLLLSCYIYLQETGDISSTSYEQVLVEYIACYYASDQGDNLKNLVISSRVIHNVERTLNIYCDNNSTNFIFPITTRS